MRIVAAVIIYLALMATSLDLTKSLHQVYTVLVRIAVALEAKK